MKQSELRQIIKEEISKVLNESIQDKINTILSSNTDPKLNTFIQPVKFMLSQSFAEDVDLFTIYTEVKDEMEFQLERANNNKDLRLIFAKIEAMLYNSL
jgi:CO dehydrogenase/acetyl-CoA synthase beta subunit